MKIRRSMLERVLREELKNILAEKALLKEEESSLLDQGKKWAKDTTSDALKWGFKNVITPLGAKTAEKLGQQIADDQASAEAASAPGGDPDAPDWFPHSVAGKAKEQAKTQALQDTENVASEWDAARSNAVASYGGSKPTRKSIESGAGSRATIDWIQKNIQGGDLNRKQAQNLYLKKYHGDQISQIKRYTAHTDADRPHGQSMPAGALGYNRAVAPSMMFPNARTIVVDPKKHGDENKMWATMHHEAGHIDPNIMALPSLPGEMPIKRWDDIHQSNEKLAKSVFPDMPAGQMDLRGSDTEEALRTRNKGEGTQWAEFTADTRSFRTQLPSGKKVVAGDIVDILGSGLDSGRSPITTDGEVIGGGGLEGTGNGLSTAAAQVNDIQRALENYDMLDENGKVIEKTIRNKNGEVIWNPKFLERAAFTMNTIVKTDVPKKKATPSRSYKDTLKDLQPMGEPQRAGSSVRGMAESKKKGSDMNVLFEGWRKFIE